MKTVNILAAVASFLLASVPNLHAAEPAPVPAPVAPTTSIDLFNGKDFTGWKFCLRSNAEPSGTFIVTNGVVHCTGQPFGYMRTEGSYRDYHLTVEWRYVRTARNADNTGVFVHVQSPDQVWPKCIENQGQYQHQGELIMMGGATCKRNGTNQTRSVPKLEAQNEKAVGEWNTYEVVCNGDSLKNYVNGKLMNQVTECSISSGAIAIQSEGGDFEVRKVTIEPLRPTDKDASSK
jgi:hypothetical protein